jgi:hypothetical protein
MPSIITGLIQCHPHTVRVVPVESGEVYLFAQQEKVIASLLQASLEQVAASEAPKSVDPIQQTVSTAIRGYIHSPAISRKEVLTAIKRLGAPLPGVSLKTLRKLSDTFRRDGDSAALLSAVNGLDVVIREHGIAGMGWHAVLKREDLKLICFDMSGMREPFFCSAYGALLFNPRAP